jgi:hypothetical protein
LKGASAQTRLGNTNTLALATAHSSNLVIANFGIDGMAETEEGHDDVAEVLRVLIS